MHLALRTILASCMLALTALAARADDSSLRARGAAIAERLCSRCHAVGATGDSPHIGAPPFRTLDRRIDMDSFLDQLRDGLTSGHPDMPTFRFTREDARAFVDYLRSIQGR